MRKARYALLFLAAFGAELAIGVGPVASAGADGSTSFTAVAVAQASRVSFVAPGFLALETLADGGAPVSQAQLTPAGGRAFASTVYPGEAATHLEQLAGASGMPAPPAYPLYIEAAHPDRPKAEACPAGQAMVAEAAGDFADGRASFGAGRSRAEAPALAAAVSSTRVEATSDGSVVARAGSVVEGASFPGGLTIARIDSVAVATLAPGASTPTVETKTIVTGAEVGGNPVEIGPDGISRPQPVGVPAGTLRPVEELLARAGISARRVNSAPVTGGVASDVIEIRSTTASPAPGVPGGTVRYQLGGAVASVVSAGNLGLTTPVSAPVVEQPPADPAAVQAPAGPAGPAAASTSSGTPALAAGAGPAPSGAGQGAVVLKPQTPASESPAETALGAAPLTTPGAPAGHALGIGPVQPAANPRAELGLLNLVVILAGVAAFAVSSIFRTKGVQATWNS